MISDENNMGSINYAELETLLEANKTYIRRFSGLNDPADKLIEMLPALIAAAKERDEEIAAAEIRGMKMAKEIAQAFAAAVPSEKDEGYWIARGEVTAANVIKFCILARIAELKAKPEPTK